MRGSVAGWGCVLVVALVVASVAAPGAGAVGATPSSLESAGESPSAVEATAAHAPGATDRGVAGSAGVAGPDDATGGDAAASAGPPNGSNHTGVRGLDAGDRRDRAAQPLRDFDGTADRVSVVVVLSPGVDRWTGTYVDRLRSMGASVESASGRWVRARIDAAAVGAYRDLSWVERVRRPFGVAPVETSEGVSVVGADQVQSAAVTGENVSVGVLDVEGFDLDNPEIADNVVANESFAGGIEQGGPHGTAVAEIVVDTAPDADLYVANFDSSTGYRNAVDWMEARDVDVIVMSVAFFGQPNDGTGPLADVADEAVANGTLWVNAAGNEARGHWEGGYADGDTDGFHNFTGGDELNYLNGGNELSSGSRVSVWLTWENWHGTDQNYDLHLYRVHDDGTKELVAESSRIQDGDDRAYESIRGTVEANDRYAVAVEDNGTSAAQNIELFAASGGPLSIRVTEGSVVSPATGENVTSVGAVYHEDESLEPFSSRGPANDGRRAVDLVAPDGVSTTAYNGAFYGTSAAAPHVGGVAALVASVNDTLSPPEMERLLTDTADDKRASGADDETGHGLVNAHAAVDRASDEYPPPEPSVWRDAPTSLTQGESTTVTVGITVDRATDRLTAVEGFDPAFASATVTDVSLDGPGSVVSSDASADRVAVEAENLTAESQLTVTYRVTAPEDGSGTFLIGSSVTTDGVTWQRTTSGIEVVEATPPSDPGTGDLPDARNGTALADFDGSADRVAVAVELAPDADRAPSTYADRLRERGASVASVSGRWIHARVDPAAVEEYRGLEWVSNVSRPLSPVAAGHVTEGVEVVGADAVHAANVTGENVSVGVLDPGGFDLSNPEIADSVVASKSFASGIESGGDHGTAVAETVVDAAPDADLYVANFEDTAGYYNATQWMRAQGVDVVVMSANFPGGPGDGTGSVSAVADAAVENGTVWVNAAGNAAERHWTGGYADGDGDAIHNFTAGAELTLLGNGTRLAAGQRVRAWLTWDDWPATDRDYDLYLFNESGAVVAGSTRTQDGDDPPRELIDHAVAEEGYYGLAAVAHDAPGEATLELFVQDGGLPSIRNPNGSVLAPATAGNVTAVGAVDYRTGSLEPFSGRGPVDGRTGVDLVAPDGVSTSAVDPFVGTSAAAAYVGGVAALVASVEDSRSPAELEESLAATADDLGPDGPDVATGHGLVNASAAVDRVRPDAPAFDPSVSREGPSYLPPGESETVTTEVTVGNATDRLDLVESFDPAFADAAVTDASVAGGGSVEARRAGPGEVAVTATDLSEGATLTVTYRVTAPEDGSGTFGVTAELDGDGATATGPTAEIVVRPQSDARSLSTTTVPPGGETTVTTTVTAAEASQRMSIIEEFDPPGTASLEDVTVDGEGSVLFSSGGEGSASVALQDVEAGTTVRITYTLTVPEDRNEGDLLTVTGTATVAGEERSLGPSTVVVGAGLAAYANEDGVIDTPGLNRAIRDWASGSISTSFLNRVIRAWATQEEVA